MKFSMTLQNQDKVLKNLRNCSIKTLRNAVYESQRTAEELEVYSHEAAPWTDRTGNARRSIYAFSDTNPRAGIVIFHGIGVEYGKYLELSYGGKYRVIAPSVNKYRYIWVRNLNDILEG